MHECSAVTPKKSAAFSLFKDLTAFSTSSAEMFGAGESLHISIITGISSLTSLEYLTSQSTSLLGVARDLKWFLQPVSMASSVLCISPLADSSLTH